MKNFTKFGLFAIAMAFLFGAMAVSETKAQGAVNEILKRMDAHQKALASLETDVTLIEYDSTFEDSNITSGNAFFLSGKTPKDVSIRINWTKPLEETLVVKDGKYILYRPKLKQAIVGKTSDANKNSKSTNALDFMNMSKKELRSNYGIKMKTNKKVGSEEFWHLELTPKKRKSYKHAELLVDGDGMPRRMKLVEHNGDYKQYNLTNIKKNVKMNVKMFKLSLPKGVRLI